MPYTYSKVEDLDGDEKVGSEQCVALVQRYTDAGPTGGWTQGDAVLGNSGVKKGTAVATFVNGRYPNHRHGNHAALFLRQGIHGIYVMDQWRGANKPRISEHFLPSRGKNKDGTFKDPSNNADAYFVIEP